MLSQSFSPRQWIRAGAIAGGLIVAGGGCSQRYCQPVCGPACSPAYGTTPLPCFGFHGTYWRAWPDECVAYPSYELPAEVEVLSIEEMPPSETPSELQPEPPLTEPQADQER